MLHLIHMLYLYYNMRPHTACLTLQVEWMEAHYLKHKHGAKNLARMPSGSQQKMASADTPQLWQLRRSPSEGNFHMPSEGSAKVYIYIYIYINLCVYIYILYYTYYIYTNLYIY